MSWQNKPRSFEKCIFEAKMKNQNEPKSSFYTPLLKKKQRMANCLKVIFSTDKKIYQAITA